MSLITAVPEIMEQKRQLLLKREVINSFSEPEKMVWDTVRFNAARIANTINWAKKRKEKAIVIILLALGIIAVEIDVRAFGDISYVACTVIVAAIISLFTTVKKEKQKLQQLQNEKDKITHFQATSEWSTIRKKFLDAGVEYDKLFYF